MLSRFAKRVANSKVAERVVLTSFAWLYYMQARDRDWMGAQWLGTPIWKLPTDLWVYQEIVHELRPDVIVETGTAHGGSAAYLASICDLVDHGRVVTIDITVPPNPPPHPRITYVTGSSTAADIVDRVGELVSGCGHVLVILDSDHSRDHVLAELRAYAPMVTPGSYVIVEDTNVNGHPVYRRHGPGPMEAVDAFLAESSDFTIDRGREQFLHTFNPRGYLSRHVPPDSSSPVSSAMDVGP